MFGRKKKKGIDRPGLEQFMKYLDEIFGCEPHIYEPDNNEDELPPVLAMTYRDMPEEGMITVVTFGLSLVRHPSWGGNSRELILSVESVDQAWGMIPAFLANGMRGKCPFNVGETINFGQQIAKDSGMDAFYVAPTSLLDTEDCTNVDVGTEHKIDLHGLYPLYNEERQVLKESGVNGFLQMPGVDLYDVTRPPVKS